MTKWEYLTVAIDTHGDYLTNLNAWLDLSYLGADGWELVHITQMTAQDSDYPHQVGFGYFKRPVAEDTFKSGPIVSYADLYEMAAQWREAAERESKDSHNPYFSDTEQVISQGRAGVYTNLAKALEAKLTISKADANQAEDAPLDLDTLNILYGLLSPKTLAQMRIDMGTWEGEYAWLLRANLCSHIGGLDRTETEYQAYRDALRELG